MTKIHINWISSHPQIGDNTIHHAQVMMFNNLRIIKTNPNAPKNDIVFTI